MSAAAPTGSPSIAGPPVVLRMAAMTPTTAPCTSLGGTPVPGATTSSPAPTVSPGAIARSGCRCRLRAFPGGTPSRPMALAHAAPRNRASGGGRVVRRKPSTAQRRCASLSCMRTVRDSMRKSNSHGLVLLPPLPPVLLPPLPPVLLPPPPLGGVPCTDDNMVTQQFSRPPQRQRLGATATLHPITTSANDVPREGSPLVFHNASHT